MSNFNILILITFIDFFILLLSYKLFGKKGLFVFIVISVIAANIQVNKGVTYDIAGFHIVATLGNVMFGSIFNANDVMGQTADKFQPLTYDERVKLNPYASGTNNNDSTLKESTQTPLTGRSFVLNGINIRSSKHLNDSMVCVQY